MIAVIFEVWPHEDRREDYLRIAASLRSEVEAMDGFISVERFERLTEEGKLLSVSFFRDEAAVAAWRARADHIIAQEKGRGTHFRDYRLRVAEVVRDYGMTRREEAPAEFRHRA